MSEDKKPVVVVEEDEVEDMDETIKKEMEIEDVVDEPLSTEEPDKVEE